MSPNRWRFYFDESFHDRKITSENGKINIYADNASDLYIGAFNGYRIFDEGTFHQKYQSFEDHFRKVYTIPPEQEMKSSVIKRKNYRHGFASMRKITVDFYNQYFDILMSSAIVLHLGIFSKTNLLVQKFLEYIVIKLPVNKETISYCLTKFLTNHRNKSLISQMININSDKDVVVALTNLTSFMKEIKEKEKIYKRNRSEVKTLDDMLSIFEYVAISPTNSYGNGIPWDYTPIFIGLNKLFMERGIDKTMVSLVLDEEAQTKRTAQAFYSASQIDVSDSKKSIGIRISDTLSRFLGEMVLAFENDWQRDRGNYFEKHYLADDWFKLSKEQFYLWQKTEDVFLRYQLFEWTGNDSTFCDFAILLFGFFEYSRLYNTFEVYNQLTADEHKKKFDEYAKAKLFHIFVRANAIPTT